MVANPFENGGFSSAEDDDDDTDEKPKKAAPAKVGSVLFGGKKAESGDEKPKRSLFERRKETDEDKVEADNNQDETSSKENVESSEATDEPGEHITEEAKREAALGQVEEDLGTHLARLDQAVPGSAEHIQAAAATDYLERVKEEITVPETTIDPVIQAEAERRIDLAAEELANKSSESSAQEEASGIETESLETEAIEPIAVDAEAPAEVKPDPEDAEDASAGTTPVPVPTSAPATPPVTATPVASRSAAAPPPPPLPPPPRSPGSGSTFGGDVPAPTDRLPLNLEGTDKSVAGPESENSYQTSRRRQALLIGGIIGYAVGRRGGRKRTEAKLKPEISRLETEVRATKENLATRELEVQRAALQRRQELVPNSPAIKPPNPTERPSLKPEKITERVPATEILRRAVIAPVEIEGSRNQAAPENKPQPTPEVAIQKQTEQIEQLSTPDILKLAESLYISGVSIRRLYETNQIDRRGLIHIVKEGIGGGDLKAAFSNVELGQERQRERAREFRHDDAGFSAPAASAAQLPQAASATPTPLSAPNPPILPNQPNQESIQPISKEIPSSQQQQSAQLEELRKMASAPKLLAPAVVIAIILALMIIWFIF